MKINISDRSKLEQLARKKMKTTSKYSDKLRDQRRAASRKWHRKIYYERKSEGLCVLCGKAAQPNRVLCFDCGLMQSEEYRKRKAASSEASNYQPAHSENN